MHKCLIFSDSIPRFVFIKSNYRYIKDFGRFIRPYIIYLKPWDEKLLSPNNNLKVFKEYDKL